MVRVSEIEKLKGRVRIFFDDGSSFLLLNSMYQERPLEINQEIDVSEFSDWITVRQYRSALEKAVAMLAVRARSSIEISQKLHQIGYTQETIEMVLYKLNKEDFLNDQDFANQWVQYRAEKKIGSRKIAQELKIKGITGEEAEKALAFLSDDIQLENAVLLARKVLKRLNPGEESRKKGQKIIAAIVRRGYEWDIAREACEQVLGEEDSI